MPEMQAFEYDIFLSYRHKPLDISICKKVHTVLETYRPPRRFKQAKVRRVFRDDDELPVAGILSDTIGEALKSSRCLLVICSPDTPESQWVDREVRTFMELGRSDKIFALLIQGTPQESFPKTLHQVRGIEDRTLCVQGRNEKQIMKQVRRMLLKVIAEATQTPYDSLRLSHRRRNTRKAVLTAAALIVLLTASGFYSLYQWVKASYYNVFAKREELMITSVIESLTFDLPGAVGNIPGVKPILAEIIQDNLLYLDRMAALSSDRTEMLLSKAKNHLALSRSWLEMADAEKALLYAKEAAGIYDGNAFARPDAGLTATLVNGYGTIAHIMQTLGDDEDALTYFQKAATLGGDLLQKEPTPENRKKAADAFISLGGCYLMNQDAEEAEASFEKGLDLLETLYGKDHAIAYTELSQAYLNASSAFQTAGHTKTSDAYRDKGIRILEEGSSSGAGSRMDLLSAYIQKAYSAISQKEPDEALETLNLALGLLSAQNPDEEAIMAEVYSLMGLACDMKGAYSEAQVYYEKNLAIQEKALGQREDLGAQKSLAAAYRQMADNLKNQGAFQQALDNYTKAIAIYQWLSEEKDEAAVTADLGACWNDMGTVLLAMDDRSKAAAAFKTAAAFFETMDGTMPSVMTKTNLIISYGNAGLCHYQQAQYTQAAPYYEKAAGVCDALKQLPITDAERRQMADTYNMAGLCLMNAYSFEKAAPYHDKCLSLYERLAENNSNPDFQRGYALSLYAVALNQFCLGEKEDADYRYKLSLNAMDRYVKNGGEAFEGSYYAIYSLYYLLFLPEETEKAYELGQMALTADPQNAFVRQLSSYSLLFAGHEEEALSVLRELLASDPLLMPSLAFDFSMFKKSGWPGESLDKVMEALSPPGA